MRIAMSRTPLAFVLFVPLWLGCGSDPPPVASTPTTGPTTSGPSAPTAPAGSSTAPDACSEIAGVCHMHDSKGAGATKIHECHELGHAHKLDVCVARKQECLDTCAGHVH